MNMRLIPRKKKASVAQSSVIAPRLFLIHIDGLLVIKNNSIHCLEADSTPTQAFQLTNLFQ